MSSNLSINRGQSQLFEVHEITCLSHLDRNDFGLKFNIKKSIFPFNP